MSFFQIILTTYRFDYNQFWAIRTRPEVAYFIGAKKEVYFKTDTDRWYLYANYHLLSTLAEPNLKALRYSLFYLNLSKNSKSLTHYSVEKKYIKEIILVKKNFQVPCCMHVNYKWSHRPATKVRRCSRSARARNSHIGVIGRLVSSDNNPCHYASPLFRRLLLSNENMLVDVIDNPLHVST